MSDKDSNDKWERVAASAKVRGKVTGEGGGKQKGEAQRLKRSDIHRAQETLKEMSPSQMVGMLGVRKSDITPKQRAFAYNVAMGASKAEAYRKAYPNAKSNNTIHHEPYRIAADPRIAAEINAYKLAAEAAKHRTAEDLRALVIQTLVQQVIDPDCPPAVRTQAAKTLGNVTEVAAFTERRESVVHHSSDAIRNKIMGELQTLLSGKTVEGEIVAQDAASLLQELASSSTPDFTLESANPDGPSHSAQDTPDDTLTP